MEIKKRLQVLIVTVIISVINGATVDESYRLPKSIVPESYELSIETSVHAGGVTNFGGSVRIKVHVLEESFEIKLHNRGLSIENVKLTDSLGSEMEQARFEDKERDFLILELLESLQENQTYFIEIQFNGRLKTNSLSGFYRSQYQLSNETQPRYLATTQFEPTRAREAFPCFDEPEYKATFVLTITHGSDYHALSNTEGTVEKVDDEKSKTTFKETPKMPTYLLAFTVSDLRHYSLPIPHQPIQRIYSRPEYIEKFYTASGLMFSIEFLSELELKFGMKFDEKIGKLDSVAVPDHGSAMENWGLILYKEQYLVLEPNPHPEEMLDVVTTVSHEIAHQFFGNLVTCKWWDQIWLNEGFATWVEFLLPELNNRTKSLRFYELFNIRKTHVALHSDSLQSTRPMTYAVSTPAEIGALFDDIAYDKAGAVLRMFQHAIGDEVFTNAIKDYLERNAYTPVTSDDLLLSLERNIPNPTFDIRRAFRTWELNKGYPIITVKFNSGNRQFHITQKRYLTIYEEESKEDENSWYIPLSYTTGSSPNFDNPKFIDFFANGTSEKILPAIEFDGSEWFIFNLHQLGYYRVNYDENNWKKIIKILNSDDYDKIHVLNRAQLVDDAMTFASDGVISYNIAFGIVSYLSRETNFIPWQAASIAFDKLDYILKGTDFRGDFHRFLRILFRQLYTRFDYDNIDFLENSEKLAAELAIEWLCRIGDEKCLANANDHLINRLLPKPLESVYICNGMKTNATIDNYDYLFERMDQSFVQNERMRIIKGLICTEDRDILNKFIHSPVVSSTYYRSHEIRKILGSVAERSAVGLELLADMIEDHYDDIINRTDESYVDTLLVVMSKRISTNEDEKLLLDLISELERQGKEVKQSTKDKVKKNINFNQKWASSTMATSAAAYLQNLRLPKNVKAEHYEIFLDVTNVHTGALPYSGEVKIDVTILESTDQIVLHSKDHLIQDIKVISKANTTEYKVMNHHQNSNSDLLDIVFVDTLHPGDFIEIKIVFTASLLTEIDGFYQDSYTEFTTSGSSRTKYLATTQFQAVEARRAFPCFDEPEYRTTFVVGIKHDSSYNAVSNMPVKYRAEFGDGTTQTNFVISPQMSTYLLAFLVSDFEYLSNENNKTEAEALQSIYTRPGFQHKAKYGLENSVKILTELEDFADMKFDLPKLDSGAIPGKGGGMENWGLILYREAALMYQDDDEDIAHDARQRGVRLIAHEIAHMFFGNLVTAEWWNYLWLNEGFATYLMYYLTDKLYPDWHMKEFYNRNIMLPYAFRTDASEYTRSMSSELNTVDEINDSFDDIAYDKASCIIRMFHHVVGEEIFKEALNLYLNENKYKPVNSQHLIDAFQKTLDSHEVSLNFENIFRTWENQAGVPVVHVQYHPEISAFNLTQQRFFEKMREDVDDSRWFIPINYGTASKINFEDTSISDYFPDTNDTFYITDNLYDGNEWYIFNKQQIGYYRVNYEEKNWLALIDALNNGLFEQIHISNRVQLIDDSFSLAHAGYIDFKIPYEILLYLRREVNFFAWDMGRDHLDTLFSTFGDRNENLQLFLSYLSSRFYNHYKLSSHDSIPRESMPERYGRELAISIACSAGNEDCLKDALKFGGMDARNEQKIPPGLEKEILCHYFKQTESEEEFVGVFNRMNRLYQPSESSYKSNLISALACTRNSTFLYELLETSLGMHVNNVNYTRSDKRAIFNAALKNVNGMSAVFKLINKFPGNELRNAYDWSWTTILKNIASSVHTDAEKYLFGEYVNGIDPPGMVRADKDEAIELSGRNIEEQQSPSNVKQINIILELINRNIWDVTDPPISTISTTTISNTEPTNPTTTVAQSTTDSTTTVAQSTTDSTTSVPQSTTDSTTPVPQSTTDSTTTVPQSTTDSTTTVPQSTTPGNATSMAINLLLLLCSITIGLLSSN